jgi:hypothetical protein
MSSQQANSEIHPQKESLISSLLRKDQKPKSAIIQEIGAADKNNEKVEEVIADKGDEKLAAATSDDGPTLLEMMMEAQNSAKAEKEKEETQIQKEESKKSFNGFKKGFFGSNKSVNQPKKSTSNSDIVDVKPKEAKKETLVLEEVQSVMNEEEKQKMNLLKTNDWMTNDLVSKFQSNDILCRGFKNQKCLDAMQLMQKDPKESLLKYQNDPEVAQFLREFGKVMGDHFTKLGSENNPSQETSKESQPVKAIEEIGPLQAKVLKESKEKNKSSPSSSLSESSQKKNNNNNNSNNNQQIENEEERVKKILEDEELRSLLMDVEFQKILLDCSDAKKLQQHMKQPETARKIRKLQQAGLVKIEF